MSEAKKELLRKLGDPPKKPRITYKDWMERYIVEGTQTDTQTKPVQKNGQRKPGPRKRRVVCVEPSVKRKARPSKS
jgi:hypothetical protein